MGALIFPLRMLPAPSGDWPDPVPLHISLYEQYQNLGMSILETLTWTGIKHRFKFKVGGFTIAASPRETDASVSFYRPAKVYYVSCIDRIIITVDHRVM